MKPDCKIDIMVETARRCPPEDNLRGVAAKALEMEGVRGRVSLNLLFTDDAGIRKLNRRFLNRNAATDVISFAAKNNRGVNRDLKGFIGDVVISVETAQHNAKSFNTSRDSEIFLYIIHGILHILGYRDGNKRSSRLMEERQNKILKAV